ncbi:MAG: TetR/AcrR family transcriptional regulator [Gammaproteobacteria bacterium]
MSKEASNTSPRRDAIIEAARQVFLRESYSGASMELVAHEAGVSKQTIYNHFANKDELFRALVLNVCAQFGVTLGNYTQLLDEDPEVVLTRFGEEVLKMLSCSDIMRLHRLLQLEGRNHPSLAESFYKFGPDRIARWLTGYLEAEVEHGRLQVAMPRIAAEQFVTMLMGHLRLRHLLGFTATPDKEQRTRYVTSAVTIFLNGVRPR